MYVDKPEMVLFSHFSFFIRCECYASTMYGTSATVGCFLQRVTSYDTAGDYVDAIGFLFDYI